MNAYFGAQKRSNLNWMQPKNNNIIKLKICSNQNNLSKNKKTFARTFSNNSQTESVMQLKRR